MRGWLIAAALWAQPAQAATLWLSADFPLDVTIWPGPNSPECAGITGECAVNSTLMQHLANFSVDAPDGLVAGQQFQFSGYNPVLYGSAQGTATYLGGGSYQGISLSYLTDSYCYRCSWGRGSTTSFTLTDPTYSAQAASSALVAVVPEPETWALLLAGLFAIAWVMRGRVDTDAGSNGVLDRLPARAISPLGKTRELT